MNLGRTKVEPRLNTGDSSGEARPSGVGWWWQVAGCKAGSGGPGQNREKVACFGLTACTGRRDKNGFLYLKRNKGIVI